VELLLTQKIGTKGTYVLSSADILDSVTNTYTDFTKTINDDGFDAILLVAFRKTNKKIYFNGEASREGMGSTYEKLVPGFQCYLFDTRNSLFPIWKGQLEIGDNTYSAKQGLTGKMANGIANSLKTIGYIAH
jgi:hypothetical protein